MAKDNFVSSLLEAIKSFSDSNGSDERELFEKLLSKDSSSLMGDLIAIYSDEVYKSLLNTCYANVLTFRADDAVFMAHQEQKWGHCFVLTDTLYNVSLECREMYIGFLSDEYNSGNKHDGFSNKINTISHICLRACQMFLEITCLCRNGFADGALARWRSLYELSVITDLLSREEDKVSLAYKEAVGANDTQYQWLKCSSKYSSQRRITFRMIQENCFFASEAFYDIYAIGNLVVHSSPEGTFTRVSCPDGVTAGKSDYGIDMVAVVASNALLHIMGTFFLLRPTGDSLSYIHILLLLTKRIAEEFSITSKDVFKELHAEDN